MAHSAENHFEIPALNQDGKEAVLSLTTSKYFNGKVYSAARVQFRQGPFLCCELYGDFHKNLKVAEPARATVKYIETQHKEVFTEETRKALVVEALAFYAAKAQKDATA